jgi:hypothetical protein
MKTYINLNNVVRITVESDDRVWLYMNNGSRALVKQNPLDTLKEHYKEYPHSEPVWVEVELC